MSRLRIVAGLAVIAALVFPVVASGQFGRFFLPQPTAVDYDSQFAFTRIRYGTRTGRNGGWEHDYPTADRNFSAILDYISHTRVHLKDSNILDLDDPRIFQNPVIYMSEPGGWTITVPANGTGRASPAGTLDGTDPDPRLNYVSGDKSAWYWRKLSQLDVENVLPLSQLTDGNSRRWVPDSGKIFFQGHPPGDPQLRDQVYIYDTDSGELEQLTFNPLGVVGGMMWRAPEFKNEYVFFTMAKFRQEILVYRKLPGADRVLRWTIVKTIAAPPGLPFFWSPEVFVHNGRSYIFFQVSVSSRFFDLTIPNQIGMSGVDPLRQDFRLLTNDSATPRVRLDPEYFITAQGPFIYYNRLVPETASHPAINDGVWRVDTQLGPPR